MFPRLSSPVSEAQRAIINMLVRVPHLRRNEIGEVLDLSPQSVMRAVLGLRKNGILAETKLHSGARGQPARDVSYVPGRLAALGIGLSEFSVSVALQDLDGSGLAERHFDGPIGGVDQALDHAEALLRDIAQTLPDDLTCVGCGIAAQGHIVVPGHSVAARGDPGTWARTDLKAWSEQKTGLPSVVENDSTALAIKVHVDSTDVPPNSFLVLLSSGIGGGIIAGGQPVTGWMGNAGEIGALVGEGPYRPTETNMRRAFSLNGWAELTDLPEPARAKGMHWLTKAAAELQPVIEAIIAIIDPETILIASRAPPELIDVMIGTFSLKLPGASQIAAGLPAELLVPPKIMAIQSAGLEIAGCALARHRFYSATQ